MSKPPLFLFLLGGGIAGAQNLPGDTLFAPPVSDTSRASAAGDRELGRTLLRHRLEWTLRPAQVPLRVLDTSLFRHAGDPGQWTGESFLHAALGRRADSGWGLSWKLWNRADGLGAPQGSVAENAWRQSFAGRVVVGDSALAGALSLGVLLERADPGSASPGIAADASAPVGWHGAGSWSAEGRWSGLREAPATVAGLWSDLFQGTSLRHTHTLLHGSIQASLAGDGSDTVRVELAHDSVRQRSTYFLTDRIQVQRLARVSWILPMGSQNLSASGSWDRDRYEDYSLRNPGLVRTGSQMGLGLGGPLGSGWRHGHGFQWSGQERIWDTPTAGDLVLAELQAAQDRRDRDEIEERLLADTLGWRTPRAGGLGFGIGLSQSLRAIRHPLNDQPSTADRPDEDVSKRQLSLDLYADRLSWNGRSLFNWSFLAQEDAYLRAVHSVRSWSRRENRLALNLSLPVASWIRPDLGLWAREQRNTWKFLPGRREGLLELGWTYGGEVGPAEAPWASVQWTRWQVKTGGLVGEAFAPDRVQDQWLPEVRGFLRWRQEWIFEPWAKFQLERVRVWGGEDWVPDSRSASQRVGGDLRWELPHGAFRGSVARVWNHFEEDAWIGSVAGQWSW